MTDPNDDMLDDLFAVARDVAPEPGDALMARVLADAVPPAVAAPVAFRQGIWARVSEMLGGWPAISGLAAATVAGIWVGVAPPASVENLAASVMGDAVTVSLFSTQTLFDTGDILDG